MRGFRKNWFNEDFLFAASLGKIPGAKTIQQSGDTGGTLDVSALSRSPGDWIDIWNGGYEYAGAGDGYGSHYPWDDVGASLYISSSNADNTGVQVRMRMLRHLGGERATNLGTETSLVQALDGTNAQTPVQLSTYTDILNIFGAAVVSEEDQGTNRGYFYIYRDPSTGSPTGTTAGKPNDTSLIRAVIDPGVGRADHACFAIPDRHVGFVVQADGGVDFGGGTPGTTISSSLGYRVIPGTTLFWDGGSRKSIPSPAILAKRLPLYSESSLFFANSLPFPAALTAGSKVSVSLEKILLAADDVGLVGEIQVLYVDETEVPRQLLTNIGQPGY